MEEPKVRPGLPGDRSQAAAEKLRALRSRANQALEHHRTRLGEIETQLSERVRQLAEEYASAPPAPAAPSPPDHEEELATLRRQVAEGQARHEKFVEQLLAARRQLDLLQSQPCTSCQHAAEQLAAAEDEIRRLRQQLEEALRQHEEDCARHEKFVDQLAAARQAISALQHSAGESAAELRNELDAARAAHEAAQQQHAAALRELAVLHGECDAIRAAADQSARDLAAARDEVAALRSRAATLESELRSARDEAASQIEQLRRGAESLAAQSTRADADRAQWDQSKRTLEGEKQALADSLAALQAATANEQEELAARVARAESDAQSARQELAASEGEAESLTRALAEATKAHSELTGQLVAAQRQIEALRDQVAAAADAGQLQRQLEEAQAELEHRGQNAEAKIAALERQRDDALSKAAEVQQTVAAAQAQIAQSLDDLTQLRQSTRPAAEFTELEQKFELALADVQKLKREAAALREELAKRPAAGDQESPELIALRSECDALTARVGELESEAATRGVADADVQQERDDLQRRFEMAVDDVRQLKQENAQLQEKLAAGTTAATAPDAIAGGDWASQRARLMALLQQEDGAGAIEPERADERVKIDKTIAATDRVIANKDKEIAELRALLEQRPAPESAADARVAELIDADEAVAAERQRLARLTVEWEEKLRAAELEFSVERAKLAREQAALRERMFELKSQSPTAGAPGAGDQQKPRRRWLSALGIDDDDAPKK